MKKKFFVLVVIAGLIHNANAQFSIQWQKCFGGSLIEVAYSVQNTIDSGFIIAGVTNSNDSNVSGNHGQNDFWVVKINKTGNLHWQKCYGGSLGEGAYAIQLTNDKGYIVVGYSQSNNGDVSGYHGGLNDYWVIKIDSNGIIQWQNCYGGSGGEIACSVLQTNTGGYIIAGCSNSNDGDVTGNHGNNDFWLLKTDGSGNIQWQKSYGGGNNETFPVIRKTSDGGYIVAGRTESNNGDVSGNHGGCDGWVIKLDSLGNIQWQKCIGGTNLDFANDIQQTFDNGYIVAFFTISIDGDVSGLHGTNGDFWVVKLDSSGNIQWQKCLGGIDEDWATSIIQANDGGYVVTGNSFSINGDVIGNHGIRDYWVVKLDTSGNIQNQICLGGTQDDLPFSLIKSNDDGYVITGYTKSTDGDVTGNHGTDDYWIVKLDLKTSIKELYNKTEIKIFPNPVRNSFEIICDYGMPKNSCIKIYNINGFLLYTKDLNEKRNIIDISEFSSGIYCIHIYTDKSFFVNKIIKI